MGAIGENNLNKLQYSSKPATDDDLLHIIFNDIRKNCTFILNGNEFLVYKIESIENPICKKIIDAEYNYSFTSENNLTYLKGDGYLTERFYLSAKFLINDSKIEKRSKVLITTK